ncbi:MAG: lysostaphin resistance A-like protein [Candidatus Hodarchaeota archaeon]
MNKVLKCEAVPSKAMTFATEKKTPQDTSKESVTTVDKDKEQDESVRRIRPRIDLAATLVCSLLAVTMFSLIRMALNIEISKIYLPLLAFPLNILIVYKLFPQKLKIPFGEVRPMEFTRRIGFSKPQGSPKYIFLGIVLAVCSLTGMLVGSILTGRYIFDLAAITIEQIIFSTVPGIWEEVFYRGILMFVLLGYVKDVRKAAILQSVIFGVFHFRGLELWLLIDIGSVVVFILAFTYTAYKTNSLIPGIVFHFLHDALLFLVRVPDGVYIGVFENLAFYVSLWIMLGIGCLITKFGAEKIGISDTTVLYDLDKLPQQ